MTHSCERRTFLRYSGVNVALTAMFAGNVTGADELSPQTFTYKTVGNCQIKADVFGASPLQSRPVAVWIHGGALIMGDRRGIDRTLLAELIKAGYLVISIDYRLAPEAKLPAILDDVRDAFAWIGAKGPKSFGARTDRLFVLGGSAGGYLTLMCGFLVEPRPRALASFWGYGDIAGPWYSRPDALYRKQALVTEADARSVVGTEVIAEPPPRNKRSRFYLYCRQNGLWPKEVVGRDPDAEPRGFDPFCPVRHVSARYPPTLLVHGTNDTDVPHEQSVLMDRELARHGVPHELISVPGAGHGLSGAGRDVVVGVHRRVLAFLRQHAE
jgi:acetyl esterase/lipase